MACANFASNSSGRRKIYFSSDSTGGGSNAPSGGRFAESCVPAVNGDLTWIYLSTLLNTNTAKSYYLYLWQNSGSTLSCNTTCRYIQLA